MIGPCPSIAMVTTGNTNEGSVAGTLVNDLSFCATDLDSLDAEKLKYSIQGKL